MDHETIYRLTYDRDWTTLLDVLHRHHATATTDPLWKRAIATFLEAFFETCSADPQARPATYPDVLEKLFLLHTGGFYMLPAHRFEHVVEQLVKLHAHRPQAAVGYARFCPENDHCAAVLEAFGPPERLSHSQEATVDLHATTPAAGIDATISLFKSQQEIDFYLAVREVYATYFVYPNVALHSLIDYGQVKAGLTSDERSYFFRGLVDCVVFDQHDGYRPMFFFELDSAHHDAEQRRANDRRKERILAAAGQRLYRIRKNTTGVGRTAFIHLLKEIAEA